MKSAISVRPDGIQISFSSHEHEPRTRVTINLVAFLSSHVVRMMAHCVHEPLSHRATVGVVRVALHSFSIRLHLGDDEMRTGSFESVLHRGRKRVFTPDRAGFGNPRALRDLF